jgi:hypothetical protein
MENMVEMWINNWGKIGVMWINGGEHDWDVNRWWGKIGVMWMNDGEHGWDVNW